MSNPERRRYIPSNPNVSSAEAKFPQLLRTLLDKLPYKTDDTEGLKILRGTVKRRILEKSKISKDIFLALFDNKAKKDLTAVIMPSVLIIETYDTRGETRGNTTQLTFSSDGKCFHNCAFAKNGNRPESELTGMKIERTDHLEMVRIIKKIAIKQRLIK